MDLRTGRTYPTVEDALAAGVPASDIAHVEPDGLKNLPNVTFPTGPFKDRVYKRTDDGHLVRVDGK